MSPSFPALVHAARELYRISLPDCRGRVPGDLPAMEDPASPYDGEIHRDIVLRSSLCASECFPDYRGRFRADRQAAATTTSPHGGEIRTCTRPAVVKMGAFKNFAEDRKIFERLIRFLI
ncbi:MAG: hypothetical protein HFE26_05715 [Clostridia bacterium]|nr:hypothetical protein [Clostridia bacterium]